MSLEIIKVYFVDGSHKSVKVDPSKTTVEELWEYVGDKLGLTVELAQNFFIWGVQGDLELLLFAEMTIEEVKENWDEYMRKWSNTYAETQNTGFTATISRASALNKLTLQRPKTSYSFFEHDKEFRFLFRTTSILSLHTERNIKDPETNHLFYIQAVQDVISSHYPCDLSTAIQLAGLQAYITLGNRNPSLHQPGHLGKDILSYIPRHLAQSKSTDQWEDIIYNEQELHNGKDPFIAKLLYLQLVRQFKYYGCTFFHAKYKPPTQGFYRQEFAGPVIIGINEYGIHIIDPQVMKVISIEFSRILHPKSDERCFTFYETLVEKAPPKQFYFKTNQGELIDDLLHDWFAELKQAKSVVDKERERQQRKSKRQSKKRTIVI